MGTSGLTPPEPAEISTGRRVPRSLAERTHKSVRGGAFFRATRMLRLFVVAVRFVSMMAMSDLALYSPSFVCRR